MLTGFDLDPAPPDSTLGRTDPPPLVSRPKDIVIVCLALTSGGLALLTWRQHKELRDFRADVRLLQSGAAPGLTLHTAQRHSFPLPRARPAAPTRPAPIPANSDGNELSSRLAIESWLTETRPARRGGSALMRLMENPEFVQALSLQRQAALDTRFAELFRQLNLAPDELNAFKQLLAEKENVVLDVLTVNESAVGGPLGPETLRKGIRTAQAQVEQAIQNSLGGERYELYRQYERTIAQRATVAQLEQRLSYTAAPLVPGQSEALVKIMAASAPRALTPPETAPATSVVVRAGVPEVVPLVPTNAATGHVTDDVLEQAQAVLAPAQVTALREIQSEQQAAQKAADMLREAMPALTDSSVWNLLLLL